MSDSPLPTICRWVIYKLTEQDATIIGGKVALNGGNRPLPGDQYPALIVRTWGAIASAAVQLQVFYDGEGSYWATSRTQGPDAGQWQWPTRS